MANWNLKKKKISFVVDIEIQVSINKKNTEHLHSQGIFYHIQFRI